jgi:ATP-dependent Clp endopeptidase proteolytic subunit ClpP
VSPERAPSQAEEAKTQAETEKVRVEIRKLQAEARKAEADAEKAELELEELRDDERVRKSADAFHHVYAFTAAVADSSVRSCMQRLNEWARNEPGCSIEIVFNSPGGSVVDGMALFDYILTLRANGHHITTTALGMAASMAGILLQAGDKRVMGSEAWLLIHEGSFGAVGKVGEVEDTVEWVKRIQKRILRIFAKRSHLTETQLARRWHRKDWWIDADEALKLGLIDEVRGL